MISLDFVTSSYDSALFVNHTNSGCIVMLLYVDDRIIITGDDIDSISTFKVKLAKQFEIKG